MAKSSKVKAQAKKSKVGKPAVTQPLVQAQRPEDRQAMLEALAQAQDPTVPIKFLSKRDVLAKVPVTFATIWKWMQIGEFPRGRVMRDGKSRDRSRAKTVWLESEIHEWMLSRELRIYKNDIIRPSGKAA